MIKRIFTRFMIACLLFMSIPSANAATFDPKTITISDPTKSWTISFNSEVDFNPATSRSIYIQTDAGIQHSVSFIISDDLRQITVKPNKPYIIGTPYSLIVSQEVSSKKGKKLKSDVIQQFKLQGTYILNVNATLNPLVTNLKVQSVKGVAKMTVSINGLTELPMHQSSNYQFQHGLQGLASGDQLVIRAYDGDGRVVEQQLHEILK